MMDVITQRKSDLFTGSFQAMASPCEILIETDDDALGAFLVQQAFNEAKRIEQKFSRYRDDNIVHQINYSSGKTLVVDDETARLLDFAAYCHELSDGLFDITSGILRRAWTFDGSDRLPKQADIDALLAHIGWPRVYWNPPELRLPEGMQIDFGGIGKEYAVDRTLDLLSAEHQLPMLVNFGGDLTCNGPRANNTPWVTGIENPNAHGESANTLQLYHGALATSGDAFRYIEKDGIRYGHILDPRSGWPHPGAPRAITVAANNCTEAGILATLAMLHGDAAETFLQAQQVKYWTVD